MPVMIIKRQQRACAKTLSGVVFSKQHAKPLSGTASLVNKTESPNFVASAHRFPRRCFLIALL